MQCEHIVARLRKSLFDFLSNSGRCRVVVLAATDALCLFAVAGVLVVGYHFFGFGEYKPAIYWRLWSIFPMFIGFNAICRLYHGNWMYPAMPLSPVEEFRRLFATSVFSHLLLMSFLAFTRHNLEYSRFIIAVSGMLTGLFAQAFRNLVRMVLFKLRICQIPVVLVGDGDVAKRVENNLANNSHIGFSIKLKFGENQLREVIPQAQKSDVKIMLACQDNRLFRAQMRDFATWFNYIEYLPQMEIFPVFGSHSVSVGHFGGLEMVNRTRMKALRWEKDILDWIATLIVLVLTSPLMVVIALLVKTTSSGPVFYKAKRLGKKGRPIEVYKFRSMYADADERLERLLRENTELAREFKSNFKLRNDPRVTPLGKFLRRTSLDELPQLLNVFKGEMSLVGPRPIVDQEVKYYDGNYEVFSSVKPGITGLWQTSGRSDSSYDERVGFDVYYVLNWSPWMDVWILIRTAFCVITMKGAY